MYENVSCTKLKNFRLIERFWKLVKKELGSAYFSNFADFCKNIDLLCSTTHTDLKAEMDTLIGEKVQLFDGMPPKSPNSFEQPHRPLNEGGKARVITASAHSKRCNIISGRSILRTVPGIDDLAAAIVIVELGGMSRFIEAFENSQKFAGWVGFCPGQKESNKKSTGKKSRHGDKYLRKILCEVANAAVKTKGTTFRSKFESLRVRMKYKKAVFAIAHKIAKVIYSILAHNHPYIDPRVDYKALSCKKNKSRWLRQLLACDDIEFTAIDKQTSQIYDS